MMEIREFNMRLLSKTLGGGFRRTLLKRGFKWCGSNVVVGLVSILKMGGKYFRLFINTENEQGEYWLSITSCDAKGKKIYEGEGKSKKYIHHPIPRKVIDYVLDKFIYA